MYSSKLKRNLNHSEFLRFNSLVNNIELAYGILGTLAGKPFPETNPKQHEKIDLAVKNKDLDALEVWSSRLEYGDF